MAEYHDEMDIPRTPYPTDVTDEEWSFVALVSPTARRRLLVAATGRDDVLVSAPTLIVPCIRVAGGRTSAHSAMPSCAVRKVQVS